MKTCGTCWHWSKAISGASARNPMAMCLHHENLQLHRHAKETCGLWKPEDGSPGKVGGGEAHVAPSSSVDDAGTLGKSYREFKEEPMMIRDGPQPLPAHPLAVKAAVLAEREACAKLVEENAGMFCDCYGMRPDSEETAAKKLADMIRGRK